MDNTKDSSATSANPPTTVPDIMSTPAVPSTPSTPAAAAPTSPNDLGSAFSTGSPTDKPKTEMPETAATTTDTVAAVPAETSPATDITTVTPVEPVATDDSMSEAHAGITPPQATPPTAVAENSVTDPGYAKTKSNHSMLIIVGLIIVAFVSVLVMFFYRQYSNLINPSSSISPTPQARVAVSPAVSPTPTPANEEEKELQSLKFDDVDAELQSIEKDLSQL